MVGERRQRRSISSTRPCEPTSMPAGGARLRHRRQRRRSKTAGRPIWASQTMHPVRSTRPRRRHFMGRSSPCRRRRMTGHRLPRPRRSRYGSTPSASSCNRSLPGRLMRADRRTTMPPIRRNAALSSTPDGSTTRTIGRYLPWPQHVSWRPKLPCSRICSSVGSLGLTTSDGRTGPRIAQAVAAVIGPAHARSRDEERTVLWPQNVAPTDLSPFRPSPTGDRNRQDVPTAELAGLARELAVRAFGQDLVRMLAVELGLSRLEGNTRLRFERAVAIAGAAETGSGSP
jgi:hypothetical protein